MLNNQDGRLNRYSEQSGLTDTQPRLYRSQDAGISGSQDAGISGSQDAGISACRQRCVRFGYALSITLTLMTSSIGILESIRGIQSNRESAKEDGVLYLSVSPIILFAGLISLNNVSNTQKWTLKERWKKSPSFQTIAITCFIFNALTATTMGCICLADGIKNDILDETVTGAAMLGVLGLALCGACIGGVAAIIACRTNSFARGTLAPSPRGSAEHHEAGDTQLLEVEDGHVAAAYGGP